MIGELEIRVKIKWFDLSKGAMIAEDVRMDYSGIFIDTYV